MMISQMHRGSRGLLQFGRQFLNAGTRTGTEENIPAASVLPNLTVDTSGERKENHLTDVTSEEETKVENHRGLTVDTSGERKESNSSPVESNSSPVESNSSPVESNSSPVESKGDDSYPPLTPIDLPMERVLAGESLSQEDLNSLIGGLKEARSDLPTLSSREEAFFHLRAGDKALLSLDGNSVNVLKHPLNSCLKNSYMDLELSVIQTLIFAAFVMSS